MKVGFPGDLPGARGDAAVAAALAELERLVPVLIAG
ncbi:hypothetical protein EDD35_7579 [Amycolatopsis thermoflava]|uniref:Uncharacterized protein n=1 Tax=Amycolatopsis thermoflava TaxID=84480 RepID=A0A3N2H885_9PSEU|nr:hypothetical protein EDD35_7579 [Amycolatopsis thermoflava]